VAAAGLILLFLFGSFRLYSMLPNQQLFEMSGLPLYSSVLWAGGVFIVLGGLTSLFTVGMRTGVQSLDELTGGFIDLLIETQTELQKVSWPNKEQLTNSTTVVLICMIVLGAFLFAVDRMVAWIMSILRVLPG
jgi:preprotein translocase subunit SecE